MPLPKAGQGERSKPSLPPEGWKPFRIYRPGQAALDP